MNFLTLTNKEKKAFNKGELSENDAIDIENFRINEASNYDCNNKENLRKGYSHINRLIREKCISFKKPEHIIRNEIDKVNRDNIKILNNSRIGACGIGSRKLKLRLNKLKKSGDKVATILRNLIEAEDSNILAKKYFGEYRKEYYLKKEQHIVATFNDMRELGWKFGYSTDVGKQAQYVIYIYLPNGSQLSWHMINSKHISNLEKIDVKWDGQPATTLIKLYDYVMTIYPNIGIE